MPKPIDILDPRDARLQVFLTDRWQLGDVIEKLLQYTGAASITASTFGNGEEFLRKLSLLRRTGIVTHAELYCDSRAAEKNVRLHPLLRSVYDKVWQCANHSKVVILDGAFSCVLLGSQNQSRGNRLESYVITADADVVETCRTALATIPSAPLL